MRRWALVLALAASCGGKGGHTHGPGAATAFKVGAHVRISDGGQIYDALNTTDCVKWPSPAVKKKAGRDAWGGFNPSTGNEGTILATLDHCDGKTQVILVQVDDYVVPVTSQGIDTGKAKHDGGGQSYGGVGYGVIGGESYGAVFGVGGDSYGGASYGGSVAASGGFVIGDEVDVTDPGRIYDTINQGDCLSWPDDDTKQKGGSNSWTGWSPSMGDVATIVFLPTNQCGSGEQVLLVDDSGYIVPIGASGVRVHQ